MHSEIESHSRVETTMPQKDSRRPALLEHPTPLTSALPLSSVIVVRLPYSELLAPRYLKDQRGRKGVLVW